MVAPVTVAGASPGMQLRPGAGRGQARRLLEHVPPPLAAVVVGAWAVLVLAHTSGAAHHVDHGAVLHSGAPRWSDVALFLVGWTLMVVAMMLPTTLTALGRRDEGTGAALTPPLVGFVGGFLLVWVLAGVATLGMDATVHRAADEVAALEARPWLVVTALLAVAGAVQLAPATRRHLAGSRQPVALTPRVSAFTAGRAHGHRCLRADGPLVLVMFAAEGGLVWMAALTALMVGERSSRAGRYVSAAAGVALLAAALLTVFDRRWLPGPFTLST